MTGGTIGQPDRLAGAVWGHLIGDAVGVPYEFRPADEIGEVRFGAKGTHYQPPGTWSDDGALAGPTHDRASGNGSLMRILPIALVFRDAPDAELVALAERASRVTHGTAAARIACALYVLVARRLLAGADARIGRAQALADARASLRQALSDGSADDLAVLDALEAAHRVGWHGGVDRVHSWDYARTRRNGENPINDSCQAGWRLGVTDRGHPMLDQASLSHNTGQQRGKKCLEA